MAVRAKERLTIYLEPDLVEQLWRERGATRKPVSDITNAILRAHFGPRPKRSREKPLATASN